MNVLITGGTGTISSGLVRESVRRGFNTYAITRGNHSHKNIEGATYITGNVWDRDSYLDGIKNIHFDVVVECLVFNPLQLEYSLASFCDICDQYIFISTAVLEIPSDNSTVSEDSALDYGGREYVRNKIACEELLATYFKKKKEKYTIVRPFFTYGAYHIRYGVDSSYDEYANIYRIKSKKPLICFKTYKVPFVNIEDFSRGVVSLFKNSLAYGEVFHIAEQGKETTWEEVYKLVAKSLDTDAYVIHLPKLLFQMFVPRRYEAIIGERGRNYSVIDNKLKKAVPGFSQLISNEIGIANTVGKIVDEYKANELPRDEEYQLGIEDAIIHAYNRQLITQEEKEMVEKYFEKTDSFLDEKNVKRTKSKLQEFYDVLIKWIGLKQKKQEIGEFLKHNGFDTVAIYGMKELGKTLYNDLKLCGMTIPYCIDARVDDVCKDVATTVITPDEYSDACDVDVVIVTAIHYYEDIFLQLWKKKKDIPILSLEFIIDEMLMR
ncbi:NAD-dependent epimerase/dehydratase family protein [Pseudobutyrivibrio xylanivorans]|uniref:Nucleoside-diphosphate-sugar epimerase n=1 Tax=Pseudobutyrivibrio xylanivorans DSM 14809 TaxID=1123012 RepID=A0A1M6D990_PSEXY|nr:NAD-dependent epimerase/dehydratase family protein [Pseudobutyrivibrio xylanivorans]SHI69795.1 Nucleoside-diphosphate-sugar epimerase [Pseudobutyrivibrio xylanivorans DSM 14809]